MKFNIKEVTFKNIEGEPILIPNIGKELGKFIYEKTGELELAVLALSLYKEEIIELEGKELETLALIIKHPQCSLNIPAKQGILDYIMKLTTQSQETTQDGNSRD